MNFKVKIHLMDKAARSLILLIVILSSALTGRNLVSLWCYEDNIYFLDGFEKMIRIFDPDLKELKRVSIKNISPAGSFDFFSVHDPYRSYLNDAAAGIIRQLDGNFETKMTLNVKNTGYELLQSVFPHDYNSLIAASSDYSSVYVIRNSIFSEIITSEELFTDIWVDEGNIHLLYRNKVIVFTAEGIFRSEIPLNNEYEKIRTSGDGIFLLSVDRITFINKKTREMKHIETGPVLDFCICKNRLFYITGNTKELRSEDI